MSYKPLLAWLTLLVLSACASAPQAPADVREGSSVQAAAPGAPTAAQKPDADDGMVCRMEAPIGSNRMKRVCRPKAQVEADARSNQEVMRRMSRSGPSASESGR
jgi:hypothetical protein